MGQRKIADPEAEAIDLTAWEKRLWEEGLQYVAGIDEVGRAACSAMWSRRLSYCPRAS